jgi:hypothetical protein
VPLRAQAALHVDDGRMDRWAARGYCSSLQAGINGIG